MNGRKIISILLLLAGRYFLAHGTGSVAAIPPPLTSKFDYAAFTRYDAPEPSKSLIYQSNGFMALEEQAFGGQKMRIPVMGAASPTNSSDLLSALEIDAPEITDASGHTYSFDTAPAKRSLTYFADRTGCRLPT